MPAHATYSEDELISLLKAGSQQAFSYLYDHYSKAIYGIIFNIVGEEAEAEDVLQQFFLKVWKSIATYEKEKGRLFTWMLNIARNSAIDFTRSKKAKMENNIRSIEKNVFEINKKHQETINTDHIGLRKLVDNLKADHREIINLAYYEGYTQEEIALKLNMPLGSVKTKVRQAILQLRSIMGK
ncbi:MAG: sigma-70 family RNA polymerase sigma factor [Bacteroidia bacterium]|nr:sigma-70 family RNA polymerase sigma factor [Bacteroidia bacterium]